MSGDGKYYENKGAVTYNKRVDIYLTDFKGVVECDAVDDTGRPCRGVFIPYDINGARPCSGDGWMCITDVKARDYNRRIYDVFLRGVDGGEHQVGVMWANATKWKKGGKWKERKDKG